MHGALVQGRTRERGGPCRSQNRQGEWVVVCDGAKALVLENAGDEKFPNLKTREVFEQETPMTREQGTDAPGRAINSVERRSAMEQTDWHEQQKAVPAGSSPISRPR